MVKIDRGFGRHIKLYQKKEKKNGARVFAFQEGPPPTRCHLYVKWMLT